jgi:hypothetical protein
VYPINLKVGIDVGGVLSKYPNEWRRLIESLTGPEARCEVYVITDISPISYVIEVLTDNGFIIPDNDYAYSLIKPENVLSADYEQYGNYAKAVVMREKGIEVYIDDDEKYLQWDTVFGPQPLLLKIVPDPLKPYWSDEWIQTGELGRRRFSPESLPKDN